MKSSQQLTIASLLSLLLLSLHIVDDIHRGISPPGADNIGAVAILVVWLVGILLLAERGIGLVIMLLGGPGEMRMRLEHEVVPRLAGRADGLVVRSRLVRTTAIAESAPSAPCWAAASDWRCNWCFTATTTSFRW